MIFFLHRVADNQASRSPDGNQSPQLKEIRNNHKRLANVLPVFKIGIQEGEGGGEGEVEGREGSYRSLARDDTQKRKHFHFTPIFSDVVVLKRFESAHPAVAGAAV